MEKTKSKKKSIGAIIGIIVGASLIILIQQFVFKAPSFDKAMMQAASELNKGCPMIVDQQTRLDNAIVLPGKIFQYNYTLINISKDSIDIQTFTDYMKPLILNNIKTKPDLKAFRDNKVTMAYNYMDKNGVFITKISIKADQYNE